MKRMIGQLVEAQEAFKALMGLPLPFSVSLNVSECFSTLEPKVKFFEEKRQEIFQMFGEQSEEEPNSLVIPKEKMQEFGNKLNELMIVEVSIELPKIDIEAILKMEEEGHKIHVTPMHLLIIKKLFEEPKEEVVEETAEEDKE